MSAYADFFKNKKVTLMGLGLLGRGVGDAEFLARFASSLIVTDLKTETDLAESIARLKKFKNVEFVLGRHREEDFQNRDMIIKAAGVPLQSPYLEAAKKAGIPIYMSAALFAKFAGAELIGVTGTRGKSTVTQMVYEALVASGRKIHLGGNVRGKSTLAMLPEVKKGDAAVLELDSWQLQGFRDLKIDPHVAVFTNLMPDHMNYYKDNMETYFHDKAAIFENQNAEDFLICGAGIEKQIKARKPKSRIIVPESLPADWKLSVPGAHNRENAALARAALAALKMPDDKIKTALEKFSGLEGRLSLSAEARGIKIYNDTNATTPEAASAALKSFEKGKILLIAGGADKNLQFGEFPTLIKSHTRAAAFLEGTGTKRLGEILPEYPVFASLSAAFEHIMDLAEPGDVVLLSPGFASFGMFKNEYDRGEQFESLARSYQPLKAKSC